MNGQDRRVPSAPGASGKWILLGLVTFLGVGYLFVQLASYFATGHTTPGNPFTLISETLTGLVKGTIEWTDDHTLAAILPAAIALAVLVLAIIWKIRHPKKRGLAAAAKVLGKGNSLSLKTVIKKSDAGRLTTGETKGIMLVKTMDSGQDRYATFRQTGMIEMGPEAGKTVGFAVPMILNAPGVVLATSNKRDLPDAICGSRRDKGRVWVFDAQQITSKAAPSWWIDFNDYVTDEIRAHKLAKIWMDASGPADAKRDAYFDSAGPNLLAGLLLACAVAKKPLSQVFLWLMNDRDKDAVKILEKAGYVLPAAALAGVYHAPEEQRGGVFGTAAEMVSFLNNSRVRSWVESDMLSKREKFSPEDFVRSDAETLIALSKEGIGSTGPLTAALVAWVLEAAEDLADTKPHGRLQIPLVVVLDEVANVCRLKDLPDLYSHYGSRGIPIWSIFQNWAQGCRVWKEDGMRQLWGAANIRIIGAGQSDAKHLKEVSDLVGNHLITEYSANSSSGNGPGKGSYSRNVSQRDKPVLDVDDIAAFELGECLVLPSGDRPFLARTIPWFDRKEMQPIVSASIKEFEPA